MMYEKPTLFGGPINFNSKGLELERDNSKPVQNMQEPSSDSLPVVELRPFTKHVWRREKSFPEFYHHHTDVVSESAEKVVHSDPLPSIVEVLTDITQSTNKHREYYQQRTRTKLHPHMPNIHAAPTGKPSGILASFITKEDRTKTTLFLANKEENPKSYSCRKQALNSATIRRQQELQLNGDPMSLPENMPNQFMYLNPLVHYKNRANLKQMRYRQTQHSSAPSDDRMKNIKTIPGRELDIMGMLQRRSAKARLRPISAGKRYIDRQNGLIRNNAIGSSLDFLKIDTKPTIIEKQLNDDRAFHLQRCRRNIDIGYTSLEILQHLQNENAITRSLTQGELMLKRGNECNKTRGVREPKILAPVVEPRIQRGKILSIRKCGPDSIVLPREKYVLAPVLTTRKYTESDVHLENRSKRSDESMASDIGDSRMDEGRSDNSGSDREASPNEDGGVLPTKKPLVFKSHEAMDQESPVLETPIRESNYTTDFSSHCDSPLIELVAQANTDVPKSRIGSTPLLDKDNLVENVSANNSSNNRMLKNTNGEISDHDSPTSTEPFPQSSPVYSHLTINRRPKVCAYDDEDCDKHNGNAIDIKPDDDTNDEQNDNHNGVIDRPDSSVLNNDTSVLNKDTSLVNNATSVVNKDTSVVNDNDVIHKKFNSSDNIANDNDNHDSELNVHDKQTQVDAGDVVDGNADDVNGNDVDDDKLLKSTTFLTSDV